MKLRTAIYIYIAILALAGIGIVLVTNIGLLNTNQIRQIWVGFEENRSEKSVSLNELRAELGFGGMIHNYKNYILRRSAMHRYNTITYLGAVQANISSYKTFRLNDAETEALETLEDTLTLYRGAIDDIQAAIDRGASSKEIDEAVRINDEFALQALGVLNREQSLQQKQIVNKPNTIHAIRKAIGYGGLLHHFKNYILRNEEVFRQQAEQEYQNAIEAMELYKSFDLNAIEQDAIKNIEMVLYLYHSNLDVVQQLHLSGHSPSEIDEQVIIDDEPVLAAFIYLNREIYIQSEAEAERLNTSLDYVVQSGEAVVGMTAVSIFLVIVASFWLVYFHIVKRISGLTKTMAVLAKDDANIEIQWLDKTDEIGDMSRALEVFRENITLRQKAESDLHAINQNLETMVEERTRESKNNERRLTALLETAVDSIITIDHRGIIQSFNDAAIKIFGYTHDEVIGNNISMLMPEPYKREHDGYLEKYGQTGDQVIIGVGREVYAQRKNGDIFPMELSVSEINNDGEVIFTGIIRDLSERNQQEEKIRRTLKMDALGKLTGGIAHDFNNILNIILGYAELLENKLNKSPALSQYASQIQIAGTRGAKLTHKLLDFSQYKSSQSLSVVNVNDLILESQDMLKKSLTARIEIEFKLEADVWDCFIDAFDMEDTMLNLSINAMHAISDVGKLLISTANLTMDDDTARKHGLPQGDYIVITVEDTGIGMDEDLMSHIFEPFFTTKDAGGTGLGLSQVYGFVQRSSGEITVNSVVGQGSLFTIFLPRHEVENSVDKEEADAYDVEDFRGSENILVVDDEVSLCDLAYVMITQYGYSVSKANSGEEALRILESGDFDLVVSDVVMPKMDGFTLAHKIQELYPDVAIQMVSGYNALGQPVGDKMLSEQMLTKPYSKRSLMSRIRRMLDAKAAK